MKYNFIFFALLFGFSSTLQAQEIQYTMPEESALHEGTWLQWPHNHLYGPWYRDDLKETWLQMTEALIQGENLHIIAYDEIELDYITGLLADEEISTTNIDFYIHETNDCWIRDNGPIFVFDESDQLTILNWGFNGWGGEYPYNLCDLIPAAIASEIAVPLVDLSAMILEGGAVEVDGNGTFMATKSSIINDDRNPALTQTDIENYLTTYLGITNFLWLEGVEGLDITDMHIDGFAKFHEGNTIITMDSTSLAYWDVPASDITTLFNATNADGVNFEFVFLPLTQNDVVTTWGDNVQFKGSYVNYYIGNTVVLVPTYDDPNDEVAIAMIQEIFPTRTAVGVDCRNLFWGGGMVHCVTQQQPFSESFNAILESTDEGFMLMQNFPNPCSHTTKIAFHLSKTSDITIDVVDAMGQGVDSQSRKNVTAGEHAIEFDCSRWSCGVYAYSISVGSGRRIQKQMTVVR